MAPQKKKKRQGILAGVVTVVTSMVLLVVVFALFLLFVCTPKLSAVQVLLRLSTAQSGFVLFGFVFAAAFCVYANRKWGR